ncbi:MAG TPA: acyl-ACP--UDP-N-acetylglucosamine O-acyltransferase [Gemmataceae bacterium]|nr:acyl-ACP--UDP-N-acetylglucosamine O-acyltransferase [Gemmataceae bacterium]
MPVADPDRVHPTAIVSAEADLAAGVQVGPYAVIEGPVTLGLDCVVGPHAHLIGPLVMGRGNRVGTGTVIGSEPQHLAYEGQPTRTEIGDSNTFREFVTVHRGSHVEGYGVTRIGSFNYFMVNSHVAHDCKIANHCIFANGALLAGHCEIEDRVFLSGLTAVHQFARLGRLSLLNGQESASHDVPPFLVVKDRYTLLGVNIVGMRRAGIPTADISAVRMAFKILYRSGLMLKLGVERLEQELGGHPLVAEMLRFIQAKSRRGIMRSGADEVSPDAE